jgi:Haem-binding domain
VNQSGVLYEPPGIPLAPAGGGCQDCHSTRPPRWPPQGHVAPFSWLLARDVEQGREALNLYAWDEDEGEADDAADAVADAEMPPRRYQLVYPDAALSDAERQVLVDALAAMDRAGGEESASGR